MHRKLLTTALAVVMGTAGCGADNGEPPDPTPTVSACAPVPKRIYDKELILTDSSTCKRLVISDVVRRVRVVLERQYEIKVLPFRADQTYQCKVDGEETLVRGNETPIVKFCDGNKVYVITAPGLDAIVADLNFAGVWYMLAVTAAPVRFDTFKGQVCAGGFITRSRPDASIEEDLPVFQSATSPSWSETAEPWQYALWGYQMAIAGRDISVCNTPQPTVAPSAKTA